MLWVVLSVVTNLADWWAGLNLMAATERLWVYECCEEGHYEPSRAIRTARTIDWPLH